MKRHEITLDDVIDAEPYEIVLASHSNAEKKYRKRLKLLVYMYRLGDTGQTRATFEVTGGGEADFLAANLVDAINEYNHR